MYPHEPFSVCIEFIYQIGNFTIVKIRLKAITHFILLNNKEHHIHVIVRVVHIHWKCVWAILLNISWMLIIGWMKEIKQFIQMTTGILTTVAISCWREKKFYPQQTKFEKIKFALITLKFTNRSFSLRALSSSFSRKTSLKSPYRMHKSWQQDQIFRAHPNLVSHGKLCNNLHVHCRGFVSNKMHHSISFQANKAIYGWIRLQSEDLQSEIQAH